MIHENIKWGRPVLTGVISNTISVGKGVTPTENMHSTKIDNSLIVMSSQGETIGNRQDAIVRSFVPVRERELALAA